MKETEILIEGLISGLFLGITIKTGINADPGSILISILQAFETALTPLLPRDYDFHRIVQVLSIFIVTIGFLCFLKTIISCGNLMRGLVIFLIGLLIMLGLVLLTI